MKDELVERLTAQGALFWNGDKDERVAGMLMHEAAAALKARATLPETLSKERALLESLRLAVHKDVGDKMADDFPNITAAMIEGDTFFLRNAGPDDESIAIAKAARKLGEGPY